MNPFQMFNIYIKRAAEIYGVTHTRAIYEQAIEVLNDEQSREMCVRFADLERKLGEIDRARAVYAHCSQMCDPWVSYISLILWGIPKIAKRFELYQCLTLADVLCYGRSGVYTMEVKIVLSWDLA